MEVEMVGWNHVGPSHLCRAPVPHQHWMQDSRETLAQMGSGRQRGAGIISGRLHLKALAFNTWFCEGQRQKSKGWL